MFWRQRELVLAEPVKKWTQTLSYLFAGFAISYASYWVLVRAPAWQVEWDYMISFAMTVCIYTAGFMGYRHPSILQQREKQLAIEQKEKYERSGLTEGASEELTNALLKSLKHDKVYLGNALILRFLADKLATSTHHLSSVINEEMGCDFAELLRKYRVQEAQRLMREPANLHTPWI
jgi:AraC-like DNA-binding protein